MLIRMYQGQLRECPLELPKPTPILYNDPMNETQILGAYTSKTGKVYSYDVERQTRTAFATMGDPSTRYDRVYYQVNVYVDGQRLNFAFVNDVTDAMAIHKAVLSVVEWDETPAHVLESMHSRYD